MKNIKGFTLGLVLGLSIAVAGIAYAQTNTQSDPNKKAECCCMAMDCCKGDSCPMMKDGAKNHAASADKEGRCCGESCNMKDRAKTTTATANAASDKHDCCCCGGESCNMKDMKHMKTKDVKDSPSKP